MTHKLTSPLNELANECHQIAVDHGFWETPIDERCLNCVHYKASKIVLMHSELSEVVEVQRKPETAKEPEVIELADVIIRIMDYCGYHRYDIAQAIRDKCSINKARPHKHGKQF